MSFVKKQERGDAVDLGWKKDFFAGLGDNVPGSGAGFHALIDTEKMDVVTDLRFRKCGQYGFGFIAVRTVIYD
jgi:hypothetical protein